MTAGLVNASPRAIQPYMKLMRLDKPVGSAFLYVPTTWSILMSSYSYNKPLPETLWNLGLFFVGSVLMRSAACTINDMADVEFDKAVERCRTRPLAAGDVSMTQAWLFLFGQLAFGLWILLSTGVNHLTIMIGVAGLIINIVYPFMKRVTYWPQLILGFAFNWGLIIGWSAVTNTIDRNVVLPMYIGGIAWTLVYDGIYAYQDLKDDVKAGVKSVAMVFGSNPIPVMIVLTLAFLGLTTYGGYQNDQGLWFYVGMAVCALHHAHILQRTDFEDPKSCWDGFAGCGWAGLWITAGAFADLVL